MEPGPVNATTARTGAHHTASPTVRTTRVRRRREARDGDRSGPSSENVTPSRPGPSASPVPAAAITTIGNGTPTTKIARSASVATTAATLPRTEIGRAHV